MLDSRCKRHTLLAIPEKGRNNQPLLYVISTDL